MGPSGHPARKVVLCVPEAGRSRRRGGDVFKRQEGYVTVGGVITAGVVAAILLGLFIIFTATATTPADKIGLHYTGGPIEGAKYAKTVPPGSGMFLTGVFDNVYEYPVTQRSYIISEREGDVLGKVSVPSADRVQTDFEVATYFKLNVSKIRQFHETIGLKYHAWEDDGWDRMLAESFKQQIEFAIQREARRFQVDDIYANPQTLIDIQNAVGTALKENVAQVLGDDYFCGVEYTTANPDECPDFTFVIKKVTVPPDVKAAFEKNRTSEIAIQTAENNVEVARQEARAIRERQAALESCGETCILYEAIKTGEIDFWVIPNDTGLTLPARG